MDFATVYHVTFLSSNVHYLLHIYEDVVVDLDTTFLPTNLKAIFKSPKIYYETVEIV